MFLHNIHQPNYMSFVGADGSVRPQNTIYIKTGVKRLDTEILKINIENIQQEQIEYAAKILRAGGTVAFPTETVYGLGANALNEVAVKKIFKAKGRPADNPLIVHIADFQTLNSLTNFITDEMKKLMENFWPGPLTMVVPRSNIIPDIVTAGLDTVAVRFPAHPIAQKLIKAAELPIAAPSANTSGKPSPTVASHVIEDLDGKVDVIIDGGAAKVGLESTVIDMTSKTPILLRPGGVTWEQLTSVLGKVEVDPGVLEKVGADSKPRSPGMKYKHYAPKAEVVIVEGEREQVIEKIRQLIEEKQGQGLKVGVMASEETASFYEADCVLTVGSEQQPETIAAHLFYTLRAFDEKGVDVVYTQFIGTEGIGMAVRNRLQKAAGYNIIKV